MKIHSEKGVSAIEFALILPVLAILTFGIIEFGILLFDKAIITNASREGARYGIVFRTDGINPMPMTDPEIRAVVMDYANGLLINLGPGGQQGLVEEDIDIYPPYDERLVSGSGTDLKVTVPFDYDFLILPDMTEVARAISGNGPSEFKSFLINGRIELQGKTVMKME